MSNQIPTEQIGSIPRTQRLIDAYRKYDAGKLGVDILDQIAQEETITVVRELEDLGCPVISDGEQRKFDGFAHYCLHGSDRFNGKGLSVVFSDGHVRELSPTLTKPPFKYQHTADEYLEFVLKHAHVPVKQAIISPSMLSLLYPVDGLEGYSRTQFFDDLVKAHVEEVRRCLAIGAHKVQIDFTEARLSLKLDPSGGMLDAFVDLINQCLSHFNDEEIQKIGIHTCPGGDMDATHSADVDYKFLLPTLFKIRAGNFYVAMAGEENPRKALRLIKNIIQPFQRVFVGVINPIVSEIETANKVRDRILEAAEYIPLEQLGTTDDCGFSPFTDDTSTSRDIVYQKIRARLEGTRLAEDILFK
ncbi:MAG: cobalamin-independent methionine synthase II family protein [Nitrosomonas sp.]|nr:cobalamin-independent methionine synthase II family protein [Nitrosomonas sp.]